MDSVVEEGIPGDIGVLAGGQVNPVFRVVPDDVITYRVAVGITEIDSIPLVILDDVVLDGIAC